MKAVALLVILTILVGTGIWLLKDPDQPANPPESSYSKTDVLSSDEGRNQEWGVKKDNQEQELAFELDPDRLFDLSYENDPEFKAMAEKYGTTSSCIIALAKRKLHDIPIDPAACPTNLLEASLEGDTGGPVHPAPGEAHRYDSYSVAQLKRIADYDSEAALVLARKVKDDEISRQYYEKAVVLTGNPIPLLEWLAYRNKGGIHWDHEKLDVKRAKTGYEIYLIVEALGLNGSVAADYKQQMEAVGIDLTSVEQKAAETVARIKERGDVLFPDRNPES